MNPATPGTGDASLQVEEIWEGGNRHFKCSTCGRTASRFAQLLRHAKTHTGVKAHWCSFCQKGFGRRDNLLRHLRCTHQVHVEATRGKPTDPSKLFPYSTSLPETGVKVIRAPNPADSASTSIAVSPARQSLPTPASSPLDGPTAVPSPQHQIHTDPSTASSSVAPTPPRIINVSTISAAGSPAFVNGESARHEPVAHQVITSGPPQYAHGTALGLASPAATPLPQFVQPQHQAYYPAMQAPVYPFWDRYPAPLPVPVSAAASAPHLQPSATAGQVFLDPSGMPYQQRPTMQNPQAAPAPQQAVLAQSQGWPAGYPIAYPAPGGSYLHAVHSQAQPQAAQQPQPQHLYQHPAQSQPPTQHASPAFYRPELAPAPAPLAVPVPAQQGQAPQYSARWPPVSQAQAQANAWAQAQAQMQAQAQAQAQAQTQAYAASPGRANGTPAHTVPDADDDGVYASRGGRVIYGDAGVGPGVDDGDAGVGYDHDAADQLQYTAVKAERRGLTRSVIEVKGEGGVGLKLPPLRMEEGLVGGEDGGEE